MNYSDPGKAILFLAGLAMSSLFASAAPIEVFPVTTKDGARSLNGDWSFKYLPSLDAGADADFLKPDFDTSAWKTIPVPSNWELHGFAEPKYALELQDGLGLYRRNFRVPADWREAGRQVCLRFEGVAYGFQVWVNGTKVGASTASAYNPHTFDITSALRADSAAENVLAVKVTTKPLGFEFDVNDDWALGGIFRDVTLFSVPEIHVQDVTTSTKLVAGGSAEFSVNVAVSKAGGMVQGRLLAPDGKLAGEFDLPDGGSTTVQVANPALWTAETPLLYRLELTLSAGGRKLQTFEKRVGLREVSVVDGVLLLNGRPIKLRGANHHDIDPETGRAITEAQMRRDLELMRKANINYVRTSHYPPQPRFLDLCDEMGFYGMNEVAIGKGEDHMNDPAYRATMFARVEATLLRDKNHPSVIVWSIGNENPITDLLLEAGRHAKTLDPSRPICFPTIGSYFVQNYERFADFVDLYAPHYPTNETLRGYAQMLKRPLILTEYAHALGLATDRIQDQWEILQQTPRFAGGSVWMFQDQGLLRKSDQPVDLTKPTEFVWLDAHRYYDSFGDKGADGLVYSDRTPQSDYWELRKVYSPVQITADSTVVKPGPQEIPFTIENRHDFRAFTGMKIAWVLQRNGKAVQQGELPLQAAAHTKETVRIPVNIPADAAPDVLALELRCLDEAGQQITERTVRLDLEGRPSEPWRKALSIAGRPVVRESATSITIEHPRWVLTVARVTGALTIRDHAGRSLVAGILPHTGRELTMAEALAVPKTHLWLGSTPGEPRNVKVAVTPEGEALRFSVSGTYPRPQPAAEKTPETRTDDPLLVDQGTKPSPPPAAEDEALVGGYEAEITPGGAIAIRYDYRPVDATGRFAEAGLSIVLPAGMTEFRWIGQGPYAGYPGKDRLNEFGLFHLNRDDLRFQGNRRGTDLALLTTPAGEGVAVVTDGAADISVERAGDQTLLSHNAVISGLGNKGAPPEMAVDVAGTPRIAGAFTLVPLDAAWPEALTRLFGKPAPARDVFRPFFHSYDQGAGPTDAP